MPSSSKLNLNELTTEEQVCNYIEDALSTEDLDYIAYVESTLLKANIFPVSEEGKRLYDLLEDTATTMWVATGSTNIKTTQ